MTFTPLLHMPLYLQMHSAGALVLITLEALVILRSKRDRLHKISGYIWTVAMAAAATSSFSMHELWVIGLFSPLYVLAIVTRWSLWVGIRRAIAGRIDAH